MYPEEIARELNWMLIQGLKFWSVVLKIKHWSWRKYREFVSKYLESKCANPLWVVTTGSSGSFHDMRNGHTKKLYLALFLCLFGFVSPLSILFSLVEVTEGVRSRGSLGKDGKLEMHLKKCLVFIQWFVLWYALESVWELGIIPGSRKGFQRENEKGVFYTPPESCQNSYFASFSLCKKPLHFPDRGSSDPAVSFPGAPTTAGARWGRMALTATKGRPCVCTRICAALQQ